jgi:hypothetical protein
MLGRVALCAMLVEVMPGQIGKPPDTPALIQRITLQAMRYQGHLPDFICTRTTVESTGDGSKWKKQHVIEELAEFASNNINARFKVVKVDGHAPKSNQSGFGGHDRSLVGFSLVPDWIFSPKGAPRFEWRDREVLNGQAVDVFSYTVRPWVSMTPIAPTSYVVGFHGLAFTNADTADMLRLELHSDGPPDYPVRDDTITIDYSWVEISGQRLLLPVRNRSQFRVGNNRNLVLREATFSGYRKYSADSKIDFDDPVQ